MLSYCLQSAHYLTLSLMLLGPPSLWRAAKGVACMVALGIVLCFFLVHAQEKRRTLFSMNGQWLTSCGRSRSATLGASAPCKPFRHQLRIAASAYQQRKRGACRWPYIFVSKTLAELAEMIVKKRKKRFHLPLAAAVLVAFLCVVCLGRAFSKACVCTNTRARPEVVKGCLGLRD